MAPSEYDLAWNLFVELRKEIGQAQENRDKILEAKIVFVSGGVALIARDLGLASGALLVIPAFAAIFFDLLLHGLSLKIRRIGGYCRDILEPKLKQHTQWSQGPLWEEHMQQQGARQTLSVVGNLGLTGLAVVVALLGLFYGSTPLALVLRILLALILLAFLVYDATKAQGR